MTGDLGTAILREAVPPGGMRMRGGKLVFVLLAVLAAGLTACGSSGSGQGGSGNRHTPVKEIAVRGCPTRPEVGSTHELTWV